MTELESAEKRMRGTEAGNILFCLTHTDTHDFQAEKRPAGISVIVIAE